jgi:hypothetical protein
MYQVRDLRSLGDLLVFPFQYPSLFLCCLVDLVSSWMKKWIKDCWREQLLVLPLRLPLTFTSKFLVCMCLIHLSRQVWTWVNSISAVFPEFASWSHSAKPVWGEIHSNSGVALSVVQAAYLLGIPWVLPVFQSQSLWLSLTASALNILFIKDPFPT